MKTKVYSAFIISGLIYWFLGFFELNRVIYQRAYYVYTLVFFAILFLSTYQIFNIKYFDKKIIKQISFSFLIGFGSSIIAYVCSFIYLKYYLNVFFGKVIDIYGLWGVIISIFLSTGWLYSIGVNLIYILICEKRNKLLFVIIFLTVIIYLTRCNIINA